MLQGLINCWLEFYLKFNLKSNFLATDKNYLKPVLDYENKIRQK